LAKDIKKITEETKINGRGIEGDTMKEKLKKECKIY
jgi:ribosome recycling factor